MILMKVFLIPNHDNADTFPTARKAARRLHDIGLHCMADASHSGVFPECGVELVDRAHSRVECDMLVAIGGDGTILRAAKQAVEMGRPLFGINTGRLGFLAAFDGHRVHEITRQAIDALIPSRRMLLDYTTQDNPDRHRYALNDVVLKGPLGRTLEYETGYGEHSLGRIRADGVIISTPTGSTAYTLSSGGPIVVPNLDALIITAICPHSLFPGSLVCSGTDTVTIRPTRRKDNVANVMIDGEWEGEIQHSNACIVRAAERYLELRISENRNFYDILNRELSEKD